MKDNSKEMEDRICRAAVGWANSDEDTVATIYNNMTSHYHHCVKSFGLTAQTTMRAGLNYVKMLELATHAIEAERLLVKIKTYLLDADRGERESRGLTDQIC
jgi:hypothetical protein